MPASASPRMRTVPDVGLSNPAATFSSVDLPQPVGPTTETNSPSAIESVTSLTAVYEPFPPANVQVMRSSSTAAVTSLVLRVRLLHERVVERRREVDLPRRDHRRLELTQHLVHV